jgi:hypothetical protein
MDRKHYMIDHAIAHGDFPEALDVRRKIGRFISSSKNPISHGDRFFP